MFDKVTEMSLLYDLYGQLLTQRQNDIIRMYYEDDLSLAEIAEEMNISRQAVHDTVKKSEKILAGYEEKLKLLERLVKTEQIFKKLETKIDKIITNNEEHEELVDELEKIKELIIENI